MLKKITLVSTGRADEGILAPIIQALEGDPSFDVTVVATGAHKTPLKAKARSVCLPLTISGDTPFSIATAIGETAQLFARYFETSPPDALILCGDRFEVLGVASAALPFRIAVAHLHGGETTLGAIDESIRHAVTKLSHLHFVSTEVYARRIIQLGEAPWRVLVTGAPALDALQSFQPISKSILEKQLALEFGSGPLLVTFHPVTLEYENTAGYTDALLSAIEKTSLPVVFTAPNQDTYGSVVREKIQKYVSTHSNCTLSEGLGTQAYFSLMKHAAVMVGNSSSGLIEAPSFQLPVVNVGTRQKGRVFSSNVIHVGNSAESILEGILTALRPDFRKAITSDNPYFAGGAAPKILSRLKAVEAGTVLFQKEFHDLNGPEGGLEHPDWSDLSKTRSLI